MRQTCGRSALLTHHIVTDRLRFVYLSQMRCNTCLLLLPLQAVREYIASYSPLHNLDPQRPHAYPALMLTASLHDTRVNFW